MTGRGRPGHFGRTGQGSASSTAYVLSGVQGAGLDGSESAENNAAYTSAGSHPALAGWLWA
jgi:hypothetical protein